MGERLIIKKKDTCSIPKGAKILSKDVDVSYEEIENGWLKRVCLSAKYVFKDSTDYFNATKIYFYDECPFTLNDTEPKKPTHLISEDFE